jgi:hypothetical protein
MKIYTLNGKTYLKTKNRDYFTDGKHLYFYDYRQNRYDEVTHDQLMLGEFYRLYLKELTT